jgi:hypothetical protein
MFLNFFREIFIGNRDFTFNLGSACENSPSPWHSGGNDRFCARLKTDISASNSGLRGRMRSCLTFWKEVAETNLKW